MSVWVNMAAVEKHLFHIMLQIQQNSYAVTTKSTSQSGHC